MSRAPRSILISAGEASGDYYASELVRELRRRWPSCEFFGCAGPHLREVGVEPVIRSEDLSVVGIVEVVEHLPRIWRRFRELVGAAARRKPDLAILTDSPDFHFRVASKLKKQRVPVVYLIAPQVWAWRKGRVKTMRRVIDRLLCIFPFEEAFFKEHRVPVTYIGHPLSTRVRASLSREEFFQKHNLPWDRPLITVLPGSRKSEALRHVPALIRAAAILKNGRELSFILPASPTCGAEFYRQPLEGSAIRAIEGEAWDAMAHCDIALAASGTVTVEAALLGAPMVTFYRVTELSWAIGKLLVDVPFYSMVNLIAGEKAVPELMQNQMTGERIAAEAARLLDKPEERAKMKSDLARVAVLLSGSGEALSGRGDAMVNAADAVQRVLEVRQ
ncbi:MAG TPA: lipid-A-disaccharide synthase [Bryobacteraceae bacterium]|nr:lipid-A-disaccharide synthase [Bryobacteraceae bacterium]